MQLPGQPQGFPKASGTSAPPALRHCPVLSAGTGNPQSSQDGWSHSLIFRALLVTSQKHEQIQVLNLADHAGVLK